MLLGLVIKVNVIERSFSQPPVLPIPLSHCHSDTLSCDILKQGSRFALYYVTLCLVCQLLLSQATTSCVLSWAKWTSWNGCFRMCCHYARSASTLLLVTSSQAVSGYPTLQRRSVVLLTLWLESRVESRHQAWSGISVCFESTPGFESGLVFVNLKLVFAPHQAFHQSFE